MRLNPIRLAALAGAFVLSTAAAVAGGKDWHTDLDAAKAMAAEKDKLVLVEFHGSDWCPPCIALGKEVLSTEKFQDFAADRFVLVDIDFPRRTEQPEALKAANSALAEKYGIQGFPTVLVMNAEGEVLGREVGYSRGQADEFWSFLAKHTEG